jgi:hypothetical protein
MTLAYLKNAETFTQLGAGFGIGTTTAWRYVNEAVKLLSARSPKLTTALRRAQKDELPYVVLDGTLIPIDRLAARQAQETRDEPAGHRLTRRQHHLGVGSPARLGA